MIGIESTLPGIPKCRCTWTWSATHHGSVITSPTLGIALCSLTKSSVLIIPWVNRQQSWHTVFPASENNLNVKHHSDGEVWDTSLVKVQNNFLYRQQRFGSSESDRYSRHRYIGCIATRTPIRCVEAPSWYYHGVFGLHPTPLSCMVKSHASPQPGWQSANWTPFGVWLPTGWFYTRIGCTVGYLWV